MIGLRNIACALMLYAHTLWALNPDSLVAHAVVEGDILVPAAAKSLGAILVSLHSRYWAQNEVPYAFHAHLPLANKLAVLNAIDYWQRYTNLVFTKRTYENASNYPDYVLFVPASGRLCASFVGRQGGRQVVELSPRCDFKIVLHEIGHVVGLWHEQSRADRDAYVRIIWENIDEISRYNFEKQLTNGLDYKEYDYQSIMHYSEYAFSKNGQKTIEPLFPGVSIGKQNALSRLDKAAIAAMYPGPLG